MPDHTPQDTRDGSSNHSSDGHHDHGNLDEPETMSLSCQRSPSLHSKHGNEGGNNKFQYVVSEGHTRIFHSSTSASDRSCMDSPNAMSHHSSDVDSQDDYTRSGKSTPSELSTQRGYERDTQAFANKRSDTMPLRTPDKQVSKQGSSPSLRTPPMRYKGTPINTSGIVSRKGSVPTLSGPVTPIGGLFKRRNTLSLQAKNSIMSLTIQEQSPTVTSGQPYETEDLAENSSIEMSPEVTPVEQPVSIEHDLSERKSQAISSLIRAFAVNESTQNTKVEEHKEYLQTSKAKLEKAEQSMLDLTTAAMQTAGVAGTEEQQLKVFGMAQRAVQSEEQRLRKVIGTLTSKVDDITYALAEQKGEASTAFKTVKRLETENKDIESSISSSQQRLAGIKKDFSSNINTDYELLKAEMKQLRDEIEAMQQALNVNTQNINAYKILLANIKTKPNELILMRADVRKILGSYTSLLADVSEQNEALRVKIAKKDQVIKDLEESSLARDAHLLSQSSNNDYSEATDTWESLYEDKSRNFNKLQQHHRAYKAKAEKRFRPGLESENKDLRCQLTNWKDKHALLADQMSVLKKSSTNWESECKILQSRLDCTRHEMEQEIERLNKEMMIYVQEYKDKTPEINPDWWNVKGLQNQVKDLERRLKDHVQIFDEQKHRLKICYREYEKTKEQNEAFRQELGVEDTYIPSNHSRTKIVRTPKYESAGEVAQRAVILKAFREKQLRAREKTEKEQELIEQARSFALGERYPPSYKERYEKIKRKSVRERWEVDQFERLRDQGLIGEME